MEDANVKNMPIYLGSVPVERDNKLPVLNKYTLKPYCTGMVTKILFKALVPTLLYLKYLWVLQQM